MAAERKQRIKKGDVRAQIVEDKTSQIEEGDVFETMKGKCIEPMGNVD